MLALLNSVDQVIVFVPLVSTNMVNPAELEVAPAAIHFKEGRGLRHQIAKASARKAW